MGVKLQPIIVRREVEFQSIIGKTIAVDAPNIIMGLFNFARKKRSVINCSQSFSFNSCSSVDLASLSKIL